MNYIKCIILCLFIQIEIILGMDVNELWNCYENGKIYKSNRLSILYFNNVIDMLKEKLSFDMVTEKKKLISHICENLSTNKMSPLNHYAKFDISLMDPQKSYFVFYGNKCDSYNIERTFDFIFNKALAYQVAVEYDSKRRQYQMVFYMTLKNIVENVPIFCSETPFSLIFSEKNKRDSLNYYLVNSIRMPLDIYGYKQNDRLFATAYPDVNIGDEYLPLYKGLDILEIAGKNYFGVAFYALSSHLEGKFDFWVYYNDAYIKECLNKDSLVYKSIEYLKSKNVNPMSLSYSILEGAVSFHNKVQVPVDFRKMVIPENSFLLLKQENEQLKAQLKPFIIEKLKENFNNIPEKYFSNLQEDNKLFLVNLSNFFNLLEQLKQKNYKVLETELEQLINGIDSFHCLAQKDKSEFINQFFQNKTRYSTLVVNLENIKTNKLISVLKVQLEQTLKEVEIKVKEITDKDISFIKELIDKKNELVTVELSTEDRKQGMEYLLSKRNQFLNILSDHEIQNLYNEVEKNFMHSIKLLLAENSINFDVDKYIAPIVQEINENRSAQFRGIKNIMEFKIYMENLKLFYEKAFLN